MAWSATVLLRIFSIKPTLASSILPSSVKNPRIAYDRVHLSSYFSHHTAEELSLVREGFYEKHGVKVLVGERAITINRKEKVIHSSAGRTVFYDKLIMATGSYPWIPPIKGSETQDCFVYRTIEDLNAIENCARRSKRGAVVGGGSAGPGSRWRAEKPRHRNSRYRICPLC
ncbi:Putidaredoxin reductase [Kluyvera cryocrescens]|uniref:Putidaredoxin reductase n=1 Tax=Kluyvera cryocrescens TaxID=580 RepID=A0A485ABW8_KLUCR|nr:Putidaredoxin reductase [Kluyvera cryocrescens]